MQLRATLDRLATLLMFAILLLVVVVFALLPYYGYRASQAPFMGGFVEPTLVFNDAGPENSAEHWALRDAGVKFPDRLLAIDGAPLSTPGQLYSLLAAHRPGDTVRLTIEHATGTSLESAKILETRTLDVQLTPFSLDDLLSYFVAPYFVGLAFLVIGLWIFYLRRDEAAGRAFALFCASAAVMIAGVYDLYTTKAFAGLWTASIPLAGAALFTLAAVFPQEAAYAARRPITRWLGFAPALVVIVYAETLLYNTAEPRLYARGWLAGSVFAALGIVFFIANSIYRWARGRSPVVREQSRIIVISSIIAFLPAVAWVIIAGFITSAATFNVLYYFAPMVVFPMGVAYSILRYRLLDTQQLLGRAVTYSLLGILTTVGYWLLVAGVSILVGASVPGNSPLPVAVLVLALVLGFNPLRAWLQSRVDALSFRGSQAYREQLQAFSRVLTESVELPLIVGDLRRQVDVALKPTHLFTFLRDPNQTDYSAYDPDDRPGTDLRFAADGALARTLAGQRVLYLTPDSPLPVSVQRDRARLAVLDSPLFVPLNSKSALVGWLALGNRLSGEPYAQQDLDFLQALAAQSAPAVERAQVIASLEKRLNELNVLGQVSQAINFSISSDDLLELIYAQAGRVMNVRNFAIVLHEPHTRTLSNAFFVEHNERDPSEEKKPWPMGQGLASEVIRTGQPILTNDYREECARRGVPALNRNYYAWMGVPLNAGSSSLGAMTVASTDPAEAYTDDQVKIISAIADQVATAIDKARLYEQTEKRARQLATLNTAAQAITSTIALDPLLQQVVESAVEILDCEAGSLFLVDEETNELVFKVTVGPVAGNLIGLRIPAGRGIVGSAVETGQTVVVNDTASDPRWFQKPDATTGFVSRAIMAVPMRVKDRTIGVVETINKRDGAPFLDDEVALLTAFASQAAVSIENARLFNSTDQALAARVEELSVMQRIDRELNAALDVRKVMQLMLDRALASTHADAALAGLLLEDGVAVMTQQGYGDALAAFADGVIPKGHSLGGAAYSLTEPKLTAAGEGEAARQFLLPGAASQLIIPIRREDQTIGVIVCDSTSADCFTADHVAFLARLADHAAIAVANARLYGEVNAANLAKSEFVSFVSHELKTPMTSIKGYADWLATGAVGPMNETQLQFISTIRGNVGRMMTIVSDLTDIARIESGRMRLEMKALPFQSVIDTVVRSLQGQFHSKEQTLILDVEPDLPMVWGDVTQLEQVLTNLMSNSHKYTPVGGSVRLRVRQSSNVWDAKGAPQVLHVSVQDTGYGISPLDQKKIFTKFFRAEDRAIREAPGTGLGLNIFKLLVELGGGQAWFESELGKGSTFHFTVPAALPEQLANAA